MSTIGTVVSTHRSKGALAIVLGLFGLLLLCLGIFLFSVSGAANPDGIALIRKTAAGCALAGILLTATGVYIRRGAWLLGEFGAQAPDHKGATVWHFRDIEETCQFYRSGVSVGLAWRKAGEPAWGSVNGHLGGYSRFRRGFMERYLDTRVPVLLEQLAQGQAVPFRVATSMGRHQGSFATDVSAYVNVATDTITLSHSHLHLPDQDVEIARIADIDVSAWTSRIRLTLDDGSLVETSYTALFDAELLLMLLDKLVSDEARPGGTEVEPGAMPQLA